MGTMEEFDCAKNMEAIFLYSVAPVLQKVKPAVLMRLQPHRLQHWKTRQHSLRKATGLQTLEIKTQYGTVLLLIYDEAALCERLREPRALKLLAQYNYPDQFGLIALLEHLKKRFMFGYIFPHEIGVFLGYATADVESFINNNGKNCLYCRHWKVYHNIEKAQDIFNRIDAAQNYAIDILDGTTPIHIAAKVLKAAM